MPRTVSSLKNRSTSEREEFWTFVEKTAAEVERWPAWKRGEAASTARHEKPVEERPLKAAGRTGD
jgi:hypothetical protein